MTNRPADNAESGAGGQAAPPAADGPVRVMLVGTLPPPLGGITVLFKHLVDTLAARRDVETVVVNMRGGHGGPVHTALRALRTLWLTLRHARKVDVISLHAATSGLASIGPAVAAIAWAFGKPLIVRKFGGTDYRQYGRLRRGRIRWTIRRSRLYLAETKALVEAAGQEGVGRVEWFPNNRPLAQAPAAGRAGAQGCRRFVYVGQVRPPKGIGELIQAAEGLDADVEVDVYGPLMEGVTEERFVGLRKVRYRGPLAPEQVVPTLAQYDCLLLPTYHPGEGYPGVVLEAYLAGLPVICTRWRALPEIVDEMCGILIAPRSPEQLARAMRSLCDDEALYARLAAGALAKRDFFASEAWAERFARWCRELAGALH